jgi:hypothetical protein
VHLVKAERVVKAAKVVAVKEIIVATMIADLEAGMIDLIVVKAHNSLLVL